MVGGDSESAASATERSEDARVWRIGLKLTSGANGELGLELGRRVDTLGVPEDALRLQGAVRW